MAADAGERQPERGSRFHHGFPVSQGTELFPHPGRSVNDSAHVPACPVRKRQFLAKVHVSPAFGKDFSAVLGKFQDGVPHGLIAFQTAREGFRIAAPQVEGLGSFRKGGVFQRRKAGDVPARLLQPFQVVPVVKTEGIIPGYGQNPAGRGGRQGNFQRFRTSAFRDVHQQFPVDALFCLCRQPEEPGLLPGFLFRGNQAQLPFRERPFRVFGERRHQRRHPVVVQRPAQKVRVRGASHAVGNNSRYVQAGMVLGEAADDGGNGPRPAARLNHQQDGQAEREGAVRRASFQAFRRSGVKEAHDSLADGDVRAGGVPCPLGTDSVFPHHPRIQIEGRQSRRLPVEGGVNVVRAALEGLHA